MSYTDITITHKTVPFLIYFISTNFFGMRRSSSSTAAFFVSHLRFCNRQSSLVLRIRFVCWMIFVHVFMKGYYTTECFQFVLHLQFSCEAGFLVFYLEVCFFVFIKQIVYFCFMYPAFRSKVSIISL